MPEHLKILSPEVAAAAEAVGGPLVADTDATEAATAAAPPVSDLAEEPAEPEVGKTPATGGDEPTVESAVAEEGEEPAEVAGEAPADAMPPATEGDEQPAKEEENDDDDDAFEKPLTTTGNISNAASDVRIYEGLPSHGMDETQIDELFKAVHEMRAKTSNQNFFVHGWQLIYPLRAPGASSRGDMTCAPPARSPRPTTTPAPGCRPAASSTRATGRRSTRSSACGASSAWKRPWRSLTFRGRAHRPSQPAQPGTPATPARVVLPTLHEGKNDIPGAM